jgi:hypothetical protein
MINRTPYESAVLSSEMLCLGIDADDAQIPDNQDGDLTADKEEKDGEEASEDEQEPAGLNPPGNETHRRLF